jgi:hypothetical protein
VHRSSTIRLFSRSGGDWLHLFLATEIVVVDKTTALSGLRAKVRNMAAEQQEVARCHLPGESHEHSGVKAEGCKKNVINGCSKFSSSF